MDILIIGAGAMGGLFGALLAPQARVTFLTTNPGHALAINLDGLALTGMQGETRHVDIRALADPALYGRRADLVLLCTKSRSTATAAKTALPLLAEDGLMLTLQNGLGNLEQIEAVVGAARAAAGVTSQAATLLASGHVRHAGSGPTVLAASPAQEEKIHAVATLFNQAGIATTITSDAASLLWSKLIINVGINGLTALLRIPNGVLLQAPECEELMIQAVAEAEAVAQALGIHLPPEPQLERVRRVCAQTSANHSSMLQDILKGALTEIDVINGAVVAKGREAGVPTPVNQMITQLIKALEATLSQRI